MTKRGALTISKATSQAAARVRPFMPGELITARSRGSFDLETSTPLMITEVTYPASQPAVVLSTVRDALMRLPGVRSVDIPGTGYMTIVREK